jgi:hypothetical protein
MLQVSHVGQLQDRSLTNARQLRTGLKLEELYQTEVKRLERRSEVCNGQKEKTTAVLNKYAQA